MSLCRFLFALICSVFLQNVHAADKNIDLEITYKEVDFTGKIRHAIAVNKQIPGPTLRFQEGDQVTINVHNKLKSGTSIHWHGVLVPWQMDGVEGVTQLAIPPGGSYTYKYSLQQSGTYWYHSHAGLQEQDGLYGAFIIDPLRKPGYTYTQDFVIVLSDWSNSSGAKIFANLQSNGGYYSSHHAMYDYNDVAYDAFLLNGHTTKNPWTEQVKVGDVVRLRFIGAGSSTMFRVKIPQSSMQIVQVQGNDVKAFHCDEFVLAPGETYDVLVKIAKRRPYIIYAESMDGVGAAYGALLTASNQLVDYISVPHFIEPDPMALLNKYQNIIANESTNDPNRPIYQTIKMTLTGNMQEYSWSINDVPGDKAEPIILAENKRYRIVFTNNTMMPHPMHIHGHWFILRKGEGIYDPLLHTILIAPRETMIADVDTDASGQWIFHCHILYHMHAGMWRVFQYATLKEVLAGEIAPQNEVRQTSYINRPIVRVDAAMPIITQLVAAPEPH